MPLMQKTLEIILSALREQGQPLDANALDRIIRARNRELRGPVRAVAKKKLLPFYQKVKESDPELWRGWDIDDALEALLVRTLRMKPMRTASGVATVTVLTKPWPCASACLYCPNDIRMPKSYLADEPACQRAERNWFDPYLQVALRLRTLADMGHTTDKVELIVLGGTWTDYPREYRFWFTRELFRALNEAANADAQRASVTGRRAFYEHCGVLSERDDLAAFARNEQARVTCGELTYNQAIRELYGNDSGWQRASKSQTAALADVTLEHERNTQATHRSVGLVIETRPDCITPGALTEMRTLGATKVQIGIQSLDQHILDANLRRISLDRIGRAFELARLFGFKIHAHFMANLYRATPESDVAGYRALVTDRRFLPDEVKMYPCALVDGTGLVAHWRNGTWKPYTERELIDVLVANMQATPPYVRVSRMIRDISSHDIMAGNKKVNLRQMVDCELARRGGGVEEIRTREIGTRGADLTELALVEFPYETTVSSERFLQWVTPEGKIAGFLRLSLPKASAIEAARAEAESERGAIGSTGCEAMPIEGKTISHQAARDIEPASASAQAERSARGAFPLAADEAMTPRGTRVRRRRRARACKHGRAAHGAGPQARRTGMRNRARGRLRTHKRHQRGGDARVLCDPRLRATRPLPAKRALSLQSTQGQPLTTGAPAILDVGPSQKSRKRDNRPTPASPSKLSPAESSPHPQLPEGNGACRGHVQGVDIVRHGYLHRVVARVDRGLRQALAFSSEDDRELLAGAKRLIIKRDGFIGQGHRRDLEPQVVKERNPLPRPRLNASDPRPGNLEHRPHRHAGGATEKRVVARRGHEDRIDAERGGGAEDRPDVGRVPDILEHRHTTCTQTVQ